ncbi:hypothetical protein ACLK1S_05355 [Escherichia coli]
MSVQWKIGEVNFKVMSILDAGETGKYGHPTPTQVNVKATAVMTS